ncbi:MAG TPA: DNA ligase D [Thermoanaerobaculia bacterium]|nr:DNA ligase D [Thermoanaerobaculia bacterium]
MKPPLAEYRRKRDFAATPEPAGGEGRAGAADGLLFVVQKHAARRLHYDFRLELDGTLKSWAVPKGPSLDPAERRLAVQVEDHPIDYGDFEGVIPPGQYGGGTVLLWDRGTWRPAGDPRHGLRRGKLRFALEGEKLRGEWLLVRMDGGGDEGKESWLLRKLEDDVATSAGDILDDRPESVASGRSLEEIAATPDRVWQSDRAARPGLDPASIPGSRQGALPDFVPPQLATLVTDAPAGEEWVHEIKFDGYRALCRLAGGRARFLTRRGHDWSDKLSHLASAAAFLPVDEALLDGEIVHLAADGTSDFQRLQQALGEGRSEDLVYYAFDLLYLDGRDLRPAPLLRRKEALQRLLAAAPSQAAPLRYSDHVTGNGPAFLRQACDLGLEGVIAKRAAASYREGRGRDWLKVKCLAEQELVIVGFTEPSGSRQGLGALLLAVHDEEGELRYVGKVGTGFTDAQLTDLRRRLESRERRQSPLAGTLPRGSRLGEVHWVEPELVAEVRYSSWTDDGLLRHPSFEGLRADKPAAEVVRERPLPVAAAAPGGAGGGATRSEERAGSPASRGADARPTGSRRRRGGGNEEVAGVKLSNPDRVLYPDQGITKRQLAHYYLEVAERILPHLSGRPLTLVRCPSGRHQECFYQKHLAEATPAALVPVEVREKSGKTTEYVAVESVAGVVSLVQLGVLEIHPWGSRRQHLDRPDVLIFDLDPGPGLAWTEVVGAARELRDLLAGLGLESFAKLTGGKGVHLVVPLRPQLEWGAAKAFARAVADMLAGQRPDRYTTNPLKSRRQRRIFIDYLRNGFGATAVAPYSTRARDGATVAVPVRWDELTPKTPPDKYTIKNLARRLAALRSDPWEGFFELPQELRPEIVAALTGDDEA